MTVIPLVVSLPPSATPIGWDCRLMALFVSRRFSEDVSHPVVLGYRRWWPVTKADVELVSFVRRLPPLGRPDVSRWPSRPVVRDSTGDPWEMLQGMPDPFACFGFRGGVWL